MPRHIALLVQRTAFNAKTQCSLTGFGRIDSLARNSSLSDEMNRETCSNLLTTQHITITRYFAQIADV